tara:strand:- start:229 stop:459 length:231 start_codon:yes stop_codon:yes gene_type:complete
MARAVKPAQMDHLPPEETPPAMMQPVFADNGKVVSLRPIPSLAALEQEGGPELNERLELPTREPWTTRMSREIFDD